MEAQARGGAGHRDHPGRLHRPARRGPGLRGHDGHLGRQVHPGPQAHLRRDPSSHDAKSILQLMHCGRVGGVELDYTVGPSMVKQRIPRFREPREMTARGDRDVHPGAHRRRPALPGGRLRRRRDLRASSATSSRTSSPPTPTSAPTSTAATSAAAATFMRKIVEGIRKQVGPDYPIIIRLCGEELLARPRRQHARGVARVDQDRRAGGHRLPERHRGLAGVGRSRSSAATCPMGHWLYIAERMKKNLKVPVAMAYRLFLPELAEDAIVAGQARLLGDVPADDRRSRSCPMKILEGREEDIIPCMACNICLARLFRDAELNCFVRPSLGHESEPEVRLLRVRQGRAAEEGLDHRRGHRRHAGRRRSRPRRATTVTDHREERPRRRPAGRRVARPLGRRRVHAARQLPRDAYCDKRRREVRAEQDASRARRSRRPTPTSIVVATGAAPRLDVKGADGNERGVVPRRVRGQGEGGQARRRSSATRAAAIATALSCSQRGGTQITLVRQGEEARPGREPVLHLALHEEAQGRARGRAGDQRRA